MPNLAKIMLFFLIAFLLCQIGVVFDIKCHSTVEQLSVKAEQENGYIRWGNGYISWKEAQHSFWDAESVDEEIGVLSQEDGAANQEHCLVMIYQITPKKGSDEKKFKIWTSNSDGKYCGSDQRKQMEKWAREAGGFNFKCRTCGHTHYCNNNGISLLCYASAEGIGIDPYTKDWKHMQRGFKEVVSVDEEMKVKEYPKLSPWQHSCLVLAYQITPQKGSEKKYKVWKSWAHSDYCESNARKRMKEWAKKAGGFNFKCWTCNAMEKDNCNDKWPKMTCWDTTRKKYDGEIQLQQDKLDYSAINTGFRELSSPSASFGHVNVYCSAYHGCLTLSYKKGSTYRDWKSCAPALDYCESPKKKELEEMVKQKEGGHDFKCSICEQADYCNDKLPIQNCWSTNDSINGGFEHAPNIDASVGKANITCPRETPHCIMQSCSNKNGSGVLIRRGCNTGDNFNFFDKTRTKTGCGKDVEEKGRKHCGDAEDYWCGICYDEDNCNEQKWVRSCWQTATKPIETSSKYVVVGAKKKCPGNQRTCATEFCYLEHNVLVRKSCAEPNYCKGSSEEYREMKKKCTDKRGEYECKQCHEKDNCNGEDATRHCWSTIKSGSIEEFDPTKFQFGAAESAPVGDTPRKCSEEQSTCITEICTTKKSDFWISRGCGPADYCAENVYPAMNESRNYCFDEKKGVYNCYACHDNDNCNVPWQGPPPAPKQPEPSTPSTAAGTTGNGHHGMMMVTWTLIVFMSSIVPLMLVKMNS